MRLVSTAMSYSVPTTQGTFQFSVVSDTAGNFTISNVKRNSIAWTGSYPIEVHNAISTAVSRLETIMSNITTLSGTISLTNQSEAQVIFSAPLPNTDYRVLFTVDDFIVIRVKTRTTTGFTLETSTAFTGQIRYDILS